MLRPNLNETLAGIVRTVGDTLAPELQSPYARSQALIVMGVTSGMLASLSVDAECEAAEIADLTHTLETLKCANPAGDRASMPALMSGFAAKLGAGKLDSETMEIVRGYLRRHVHRLRQASAPGLAVFGLNIDWRAP
jgi:hypothetical protein